MSNTLNITAFLSSEHTIQTIQVRRNTGNAGTTYVRTSRKIIDLTMLPTIRALLNDASLVNYVMPFQQVGNEITMNVLHRANKKPQAMDVYVFKIDEGNIMQCYLKNSFAEPYDPTPLRNEALSLVGVNEKDRVFLSGIQHHERPLNKRDRQRYEAIKKRIEKIKKD